VQPLVDISLQSDVARQQHGLLREVERRVGMDRAQLRVQALLEARLDRVGDHHVGLARNNAVEDRHVVGIHRQRRVRRAGTREALVGAARIDDQPHLGPVDVRQSLVLVRIVAARDRCLAVAQVGQREEGLLLALQRDRDAAHRKVETIVAEVAHHRAPGGGHHLQLHAQRGRQVGGERDVEADEAAGRAVGEGLVVAGAADAQRAARQDLVEPARRGAAACRRGGRRLGGLRRGRSHRRDEGRERGEEDGQAAGDQEAAPGGRGRIGVYAIDPVRSDLLDGWRANVLPGQVNGRPGHESF
jgi:hypothetical protein